jgi:hypothetical protein
MRRFLVVIAAVTLFSVGQVMPVSAHAATCTITGYTPRSVVVGLSPVRSTFKVRSTGCETQQAKNWEIDASAPGGGGFLVDSGAPYVDFFPYDNSEAGDLYDVKVSMQMTKSKSFPDSFALKRRTGWDKTNASPEPVKKGAKITVQGRLRIANWHEGRYDGYTKRTVAVEFRTETGSYRQMKTATTGTGGYLKTTVTANTDGYWRLRYGGNSYAGGATMGGDFVDAK